MIMKDTNNTSTGLGDTIAKITSATRLNKVAESIALAVGAKDCGCNKRRDKLNTMFPYNTGRTANKFPTKE